MSERGIEVHNGKVIIPGDAMKQLQLGTWASPLTQVEAGQIVVSAVVNAIALGGDVHGGYFGVKASVSLTGDLRGARARATVNDGIVVTGSVYGAVIETEVLGAGEITAYYEGLRIENYVEAGADISAVAHYSIFIANYITSEPSSYSFIRMSENGASTVRSVFMVSRGGACLDISYIFELTGSNPSAWSGSGTVSGAAGHLKIRVGAQDKYIALYDNTP